MPTQKQSIQEANQQGSILAESRKKEAKKLADMLGSKNALYELQKYFLPEFDPAKAVKGQVDIYAKVATDGVPMEYIGHQFSVITEARQKLLSIFNEIEKAFEAETQKDGKTPLRK